MQHRAVNPTENGAVRAHCDCQHRRRGKRESGILAELPRGKANILEQTGHDRLQ
jgi:hypothetical protein